MSSGDMEGVEHEVQSICQYISSLSHNPQDARVSSLGTQCEKICKEFGFEFATRFQMDPWFMRCHQSRSRIQGLSSSGSGDAVEETDKLYHQFFDEIDTVIRSVDACQNVQLSLSKQNIEEKYNNNRSKLVEVAIKCVDKEQQLLATHRQIYELAGAEADGGTQQSCVRLESEQKLPSFDIRPIENFNMDIEAALSSLERQGEDLSDMCQQKDRAVEKFQLTLEVQQSASRTSNGVRHGLNRQDLQNTIDRFKSDVNSLVQGFRQKHQEVVNLCQRAYDSLFLLLRELRERIQQWRRELQLNYAELFAEPDLSQIKPWCSEVARILHDLVSESMSKWGNVLDNLPPETSTVDTQMTEVCSQYSQVFEKMQRDFIQSTFVVTSQVGNKSKNSTDNKPFCIKTGTKKFPVFNVRILAADPSLKSKDMTAHFVSESDLNSCFNHGSLDLTKLQRKWTDLGKLKLTKEFECCFQSLKLSDRKFDRKESKPVHEEKYRVIFVIKIDPKQAYWTLSLPLTVVTGSIQEAACLASIMWQCYFVEDVFSLPQPDSPEDKPWCQVAKMLQLKIHRLSTHSLTEENLQHLGNRLLGEEDSKSVSLNTFCWAHMKDMEFTFWSWFLGIYNLLDQFLRPYWGEGLIVGFLDKEEARRQLASCEPGTFILRFSDNHITKSQGLRTVYGRLTSCVVVPKTCKSNKRNAAGQFEMVSKTLVESVDVADFKKLDNNGLANILSETWIKGKDGSNQMEMYKFLYPTGQARQELFDKHCNEKDDKGLEGYRPTRDAYIAVLEQQLAKLNVSDNAISWSEQNCKSGGSKAKKARKVTSRKQSSISSPSDVLSDGSTSLDSSVMGQSPPYPSLDPFSDTGSIQTQECLAEFNGQTGIATEDFNFPPNQQAIGISYSMQSPLSYGQQSPSPPLLTICTSQLMVDKSLPSLAYPGSSQSSTFEQGCLNTVSQIPTVVTQISSSELTKSLPSQSNAAQGMRQLKRQSVSQQEVSSGSKNGQVSGIKSDSGTECQGMIWDQETLKRVNKIHVVVWEETGVQMVLHDSETVIRFNVHQAAYDFMSRYLSEGQFSEVILWAVQKAMPGIAGLLSEDLEIFLIKGASDVVPQEADIVVSSLTDDVNMGVQTSSTSAGGLSDISIGDMGIDSSEITSALADWNEYSTSADS